MEVDHSYPSVASNAYIQDLVFKLHHNAAAFEDEEGVSYWINKYKSYELRDLSIRDLDLVHSSTSLERVEIYASFATDCPPIVIDGETGWIIDGYHRANSYMKRGRLYIQAYVGVNSCNDWADEMDNGE